MIKFYTIYSIEFIGDMLELNYLTEFTDKAKVLNFIEVKNFEVNSELESELFKEFFTVVKKDGSIVPNKNYKLNHLNYKFCVVSEYDKDYN